MSLPGTPRLVLYHRIGCHLCDEMLTQLQGLQANQGFELEVKDVDEDRQLYELYNERVPVLSLQGRDLCQYFLDEEVLQQALRGVSGATEGE